MRVRINVQPSGAYNGQPWPAVGDEIDLPDHVALGMLQAGTVAAVKAEPVPEKAVASKKPETRKGLTAKDV